MKTKLDFQSIETVECDALIVVAFEGQTGGPLAKLVDELYETKEFAGKPLDLVLLHHPEGFKARRLLVVGGGKSDKFNSVMLRRAAGTALRYLKSKCSSNVAM